MEQDEEEKQDEFRGYVRAKLERFDEHLEENAKVHLTLMERIDKLEKDVMKHLMEWRALRWFGSFFIAVAASVKAHELGPLKEFFGK